jgi:hypothetical protein
MWFSEESEMKYTITLDDDTLIGTAKTAKGARTVIVNAMLSWITRNKKDILSEDTLKEARDGGFETCIIQYLDEWDMPVRFNISEEA